ncbi:DNA/RNA nuclease SfsA [Thermofilum pendens]|uniref:Sugar fermentation stimulation protein n=1 Tax=Thermofilum pendens (strain DSM 2475 / Hrk 5) TaxID=368408 RepID=A1S183_THEPD|nr:DNA/RNA nuclease SfsA [Thermofilum pendens]ABL79213.1 sugar fermentation stimulation protein [Thermofilum pendens Hrk 5]
MTWRLVRLPEPSECRVIRRENRFVVLVEVEGRAYRAHINNTGRLLEFLVPGRRAFCLRRERSKTAYRLFAVEDAGSAALIDTALQMNALESLFEQGIEPWSGCSVKARAPRLGSSRLDYLLVCNGEEVFVEVKSAVLREDSYAMYPDCPTLRGRRQISELIRLAEGGGKAMIIFVAALPGVKAFKPYGEGDPEVAVLLGEAKKKGVVLRAVALHYDPSQSEIVLDDPDLPVVVP